MIRRAAFVLTFGIVAGCAAARPDVRAPARPVVAAQEGKVERTPAPVPPAGPRLRPGGNVRQDESLALALEWNPALRAARRRVGLAEADVVTAEQFPFNPELQVSGASDRLTGNEGESNIAVGLSQTFETGGQRGHRIEAASRALDAARATIADAERRLRQEVSVAFFDALLARRRLAIAEGQLDVNRRLLEVAEARQRAGDASEVEVNLVRLEARQAEADRLARLAEVETARAALRALLGLSREGPLEVEGAFPPPRIPLEGDLVTGAIARRPDVEALRRERERAAAVVALERASRYPNVAFGLFYELDRGTLDGPGGATLRDKDHLLGAGISIPIPIFNRRQGEILAAEREVDRLEAEAAALETTIRRDVAVARERLRAAIARATLFEGEIAPLAERNLEQTREAYRLGQIGTIEVLRAQDERNKVALAAAEALHDRAVAEAALEAAIGGVK